MSVRWRQVTHALLLDLVRHLDEQLLVLLRILAADEDLDGETATLDLLEMLGWKKSVCVLVMSRVDRTFLRGCENVQRLGCEQHQRRRKLVAQKPELHAVSHSELAIF